MKIVFAFCVICITFQLVCKRRVEIRIVYALEVKVHLLIQSCGMLFIFTKIL